MTLNIGVRRYKMQKNKARSTGLPGFGRANITVCFHKIGISTFLVRTGLICDRDVGYFFP